MSEGESDKSWGSKCGLRAEGSSCSFLARPLVQFAFSVEGERERAGEKVPRDKVPAHRMQTARRGFSHTLFAKVLLDAYSCLMGQLPY
jgi:hypothetical protein